MGKSTRLCLQMAMLVGGRQGPRRILSSPDPLAKFLGDALYRLRRVRWLSGYGPPPLPFGPGCLFLMAVEAASSFLVYGFRR